MINQKLNSNLLNNNLNLFKNDYEKNLKILKLSIEYFYSSINDYNNLKNNYSFNFFTSNITISYIILFQLFLLKNGISYSKSNNINNTYNLIRLFKEIDENIENGEIKLNFIFPYGMKEHLELLLKLRNIFEHKPITEEILNILEYDSYMKNEYIGNSYFLVKNYLFLLKNIFEIDLKINIFPLTNISDFNDNDYLFKFKNNSLIKEINDYIENLDDKLKFNILNFNNFNNFKKGYKLLPDIYNDKNWCKSYQFLKRFWKNNPDYKMKKNDQGKNFTFRSWPEIYKFLKIEPDWKIPISKKADIKFFYYDDLKEEKIKHFFTEYNYNKFRSKIRELKTKNL